MVFYGRSFASYCFFRAFVCRQPALFLGPSRSGQRPGLRCVADGALRHADDRCRSASGGRIPPGGGERVVASFPDSGAVSRIDLWRLDGRMASVAGRRALFCTSLPAIAPMDSFSRGCRFDRNWTFPLIGSLSTQKGTECKFRPSFFIRSSFDLRVRFFFSLFSRFPFPGLSQAGPPYQQVPKRKTIFWQ